VTVLSEPFTVGMAIGFPLVLAGMVLATSPSPKKAAEPGAPPGSEPGAEPLATGPPLEATACRRED
jgi:hypothetical protein